MNNFDDRLDKLEVAFKIKEGKEISTEEEFYEKYGDPDWRHLFGYFDEVLDKIVQRKEQERKIITNRDWHAAIYEAFKEMRESPECLKDKRLQRAIKCKNDWHKVHSRPPEVDEFFKMCAERYKDEKWLSAKRGSC